MMDDIELTEPERLPAMPGPVHTSHSGSCRHVRAMHANPEDCPGYYNFGCVVCNLYICDVCGGSEGSLLPFCPGRRLTVAEDAANYRHYGDGTGPFARATTSTLEAAVKACAARFMDDVGSMPPPRPGAHRLYAAVCSLSRHVGGVD